MISILLIMREIYNVLPQMAEHWENMKISEALGFHQNSSGIMISFAGGGGKTSSVFKLAYELADKEKKILITTTTAMYNPAEIDNPYISVLGDHVTEEGKLRGISKEKADNIYKEGKYDIILVEADGSRGRPIKAPANHEPVIPEATHIMIGVIGMDAFGKAVNSDYVHRPEILAELTGSGKDSLIDEELIIKLISNPKGLFKNCPLSSKKILLLNKVLDERMKAAAFRIGYSVLEVCSDIDRVLIGAVQEKEPVIKLLMRCGL